MGICFSRAPVLSAARLTARYWMLGVSPFHVRRPFIRVIRNAILKSLSFREHFTRLAFTSSSYSGVFVAGAFRVFGVFRGFLACPFPRIQRIPRFTGFGIWLRFSALCDPWLKSFFSGSCIIKQKIHPRLASSAQLDYLYPVIAMRTRARNNFTPTDRVLDAQPDFGAPLGRGRTISKPASLKVACPPKIQQRSDFGPILDRFSTIFPQNFIFR